MQNPIPDEVFKRIFLYLDHPLNLANVNKQISSLSHQSSLKAQWLLLHPQVLLKWAKTQMDKRTVTEIEYIEERKWIQNHEKKIFPESILNAEVCLGIIQSFTRTKISETVEFMQSGVVLDDISIGIIFKAIWSYSCLHAQLDLIQWVLQEKPVELYRNIDRVAWREATFTAIENSDVQKSLLFKTILSARPDLYQDVPRATILAARLGKLDELIQLMELNGYKTTDILLDSVKEATENVQEHVLKYLMPLVGKNDQERNEMLSQFEDMAALQKASEDCDWTLVDQIIERWRQIGKEAFKKHWHMAIEFGCHTGNLEFVRKLFELKDAFRPTVRMLALALGEGHDYIAKEIIHFIPRYSGNVPDENDDKHQLLGDLPADHVKAYEQLLLRYCVQSDPQIALELAEDTNQKITALSGSIHRTEVVEFLVRSGKIQKTSKKVQDAMWAVLVNGRVEVARILRDSGVPLGWMEPSREKLNVDEPTENSKQEPNNALVPPPSNATTMLMSALGGDWNNMTRGLRAGSGENIFESLDEIEGYLNAEIEAAHNKDLKYRRSRSESVGMDLFIKPRMLVDPKDNFWTAFLSGNANEIKKYVKSKAPLGWMEPALLPSRRKSHIKTEEKNKGDDDEEYDYLEGSKEQQDTWGEVLGIEDTVKDEQMDLNFVGMYLGLGGVLPRQNSDIGI